jgi:peptidylprolyl isomerase
MQTIVYNATSGSKLGSTWDENKADCSLALDSGSASAEYLKVFTGQKIGATIAFGIPSTSSSSSSSSTSSSGSTSTTAPYVYIETITSVKNDLKKATGTKVTDIPSSLPKVTLASNGKPSISKAELKKYKATKKLVTQTLIKGKGAKVTSSNGIRVQYSGWLLNGTQFDSSWKTGTPLDVTDLSTQVIKGWGQGLKGQTVGSQVLLIIPPSLGYGTTAQGSIPKNSTLVFVIDILAAY